MRGRTEPAYARCSTRFRQPTASAFTVLVGMLVAACSGDIEAPGSSLEPMATGIEPGAAPAFGPEANASSPTAGGLVPAASAGEPTGSASDDPSNPADASDADPSATPSAMSGSPGTPGAESPAPSEACNDASEIDVGLSKMRRLTRVQLNNTLRDLLGVVGEPASVLVPDERVGPFDSNSIAPITDLIVQQHQEIAEHVAQEVVVRAADIAGCELASAGCPGRFIENFGARAFRRPLDEEETSGLLALYELGSTSGGPEHGFQLVMEAVLQSPSFLYLTETGADGRAANSPTPVSADSLASRLSYFLWNTLPDDELLERAGDGSLLTDAELIAQVDRMLEDPRASDTVGLFHIQLLRLDHLVHAEKDTSLFPEFDAELADAMLQEVAAFTSDVVLEGDGRLNTLLTASFAYPRGGLFELYGVTQPAGFTPGDRVELEPTERSGLLTQAAFLASHAKRNATSPVHRGIIVRENLLCQTIPPPPNDVSTVLPPATAASTTRERFAQHLADPTCAGCHVLIDPIGLSFENYDGIGRYRTMEGSQAVDASGAIVGGGDDLADAYSNAVEMTKLLGDAQSVRDCLATQWFRFALGRTASQADTCSVAAVREGFAGSGGNIRALLAEIVLSDAFGYVRSTATQEVPQ